MNRREFIEAIYKTVFQGSAHSYMHVLDSAPPGRKPQLERVRLHEWYQNLSSRDQDLARLLVQEVAGSTTYAFLLVLDHKLAIENTEDKGTLELWYRGPDGTRVWLNEMQPEDFPYLFKEIRDTEGMS